MKYYVEIGKHGDGSKNNPFGTIKEAADIAKAGDEVIVAPGIYREKIIPKNSGIEGKSIVYRSLIQKKAIISGAERADFWTYEDQNVWKLAVPNSVFGDFNPFVEMVKGDWFDAKCKAHRGDVFLNNKSMYEVFDIDEVYNPTEKKESWNKNESVYVWYCEQDGGSTIIYANFHGINPNKENVEISVRDSVFFPGKMGINYITVSGFGICKAATNWAPPTAMQKGMIGPLWSKGWIIEDCEIYESKCCGISLGKYYQEGNDNKWTTKFIKDGTQTQRDAVCMAINDGWDKENIGSHIVRRCNIHDCGQAGIVGHMGCAFSIIEDNYIHHINNKQNLRGAEIGGIKFHAAIDTIIRRNHFEYCTRGLWLDWQAQGTRVSGNLFNDNVMPNGTDALSGLAIGEDLFIEVSHGPTIVDNNIMLSDMACRISAQGIAFVHNFIAGSFTYVGKGCDNGGKIFATDRYTPYHVPHSTKIAGFMTILHGDVRFINNIFTQKNMRVDLMEIARQRNQYDKTRMNFACGTFVYDDYPLIDEYMANFKTRPTNKDVYYDHLPVYFEGNIYFGGARPMSKEKDATVCEDALKYELIRNGSAVSFICDLGKYITDKKSKVITSSYLGFAFESEERFENPDGFEITFDSDICGYHRNLVTYPGPFANLNGKYLIFYHKNKITGKVIKDEHIIKLGENNTNAKIMTKAQGKYIAQKDISSSNDENTAENDKNQSFDEVDGNLNNKNRKDANTLSDTLKNLEDKYNRKSGDFDEEKVYDTSHDGPYREKKDLKCAIALVNCNDISVSSADKVRKLEEIFIDGNTVWFHLQNDVGVTEIDCAYAIGHFVPSWSMEAEDIVPITRSEGTMSLGICLATLLRTYIDKDLQNTRNIEEDVMKKEGKVLQRYGIEIRLRQGQLKCIRNHKFISLMEAAEILSRTSGDVIAEEI